MSFWKFICSDETEAECFRRALFGYGEAYLEEVMRVRRGDMLVLYNFDSDVLFGPFRAESDGGRDLEPEAWGGRFPAQVRVSWSIITALRDASRKYPFLREKRAALDQQEFYSISEMFQYPALPPDILEEIRRLDSEIHEMAHRIEESLMGVRRRHPADRIVDLELCKAEFFNKMRDFVWAVRRLDRETRLLGLPTTSSSLFKETVEK